MPMQGLGALAWVVGAPAQDEGTGSVMLRGVA